MGCFSALWRFWRLAVGTWLGIRLRYSGWKRRLPPHLTDIARAALIRGMKAILFYMPKPPDDIEPKRSRWWTCVGDVSKIATTSKGVEELTLGCWRIGANDGLHFLGLGIDRASKDNLEYKFFGLEEVPIFDDERK